VEGEHGCVRGGRVFVDRILIILLEAVQDEEPLADLVVTPAVLLVTVETEAKATALILLGLVQALDRAAFDRRRALRRGCLERRYLGGSRTLSWCGENAARILPSWEQIGLHELELAGEAHGGSKARRVLLLDLETEWRQETPGEELHTLGLIKAAGARQQSLESVLVILHHPGAAA